jgi:stage V sporulation protein AE
MDSIIKAFFVGGAICTIGQLILNKTQLSSGKILVIFVVSGVVLSALGIYQYIADFGGAGASVPLTGFGHTLAQGVKKAVDENGIMGVLTGGVLATAGGIAAAVVFGYINALIFNPRTKK